MELPYLIAIKFNSIPRNNASNYTTPFGNCTPLCTVP